MAMRLDEAISGVRTELGVKVFGDSLAVLEQKAREIRDVIADGARRRGHVGGCQLPARCRSSSRSIAARSRATG